MLGLTRCAGPLQARACLGLAVFALACATPARLRVHQDPGFSQLRTWAWLPAETRHVEAPDADTWALESRIAQRVAEALRARGFEQATRDPDFHVTFGVHVYRQRVAAQETGAEQQLSSLHSSGSITVQSMHLRMIGVETGRIVVSALDRAGHVVWRGEITRRVEGTFEPALDDTLSRMFAALPDATAAPDARSRRLAANPAP